MGKIVRKLFKNKEFHYSSCVAPKRLIIPAFSLITEHVLRFIEFSWCVFQKVKQAGKGGKGIYYKALMQLFSRFYCHNYNQTNLLTEMLWFEICVS